MKCNNRFVTLPLLSFCILLCIQATGCRKSDLPINNNPGSTITNTLTVDDDSTQKGSWDNTATVLCPSADGTEAYTCDVATIDASHSSEGYIMVSYYGDNPKVKLQITGPDSVTYTYDLHGDYEVFPLTAGNGKYIVGVYENISGTQYSGALSSEISVEIANSFSPYLYPNQYVNFSASSLPVSKGSQLAYSCFDYASVMATMLRSQRIPTRLEVGYMGEEYHAWISIYIENVGWVNGIIEFDGKEWNLMDPTFASTSGSPMNFISENDKYITKYVY